MKYIILSVFIFSACSPKKKQPDPQVYYVVVDSLGKDHKLYKTIRLSNDSLSVYSQKQFDAIRNGMVDTYLHYNRLWYNYLKTAPAGSGE